MKIFHSQASGLHAGLALGCLILGCMFWTPTLLASEAKTDTETEIATEAQELGVQEVIALALIHNPAYQAELARRDEVAGAVVETSADAWPQVDLVASWNRTRNPSLLNSRDFEDLISQFPDFEPGEQELWGLAVEVSQPLYSGGKVQAAVDLARLVVDITDAQVASARLDLALGAAETFYRALKARRALDRLESQRVAREGALKVVNDRFELGEATRLEKLRAEAALAEVAPTLAEARGELRVQESILRSLLGFGPNDPLLLTETSSPDTEASSETPEGLPKDNKDTKDNIVAWLSLAAENRPELVDLDLQLEALDRQKVVTEAEGRPQLDLSGSYGRQVRLLDDLEENLFADWRVTVGMKWNLFDGGRIKGQVAQLESRRDQLRFQREEQVRRIALDIRRSLAGSQTARERLAAARPAAAAAREAARVAAETYQLGVGLQADLLDAQDLAIEQELMADDAYYDSLTESARLLRAVGLSALDVDDLFHVDLHSLKDLKSDPLPDTEDLQ